MDVEKILAEKRRRESEPKALPMIKASSGLRPPSPEEKGKSLTPALSKGEGEVSLLNELEAEMIGLKKERAILSSQNSILIAQVEEKLKKESALLAAEFMKGNLPMPELAEHYAKMQSILVRTTQLYDDIGKVKRGEKLIEESPMISDNDVLRMDAMRGQIRALDSVIAKTGTKIKAGKPRNPDRVIFWKEKLALANAKREDLKAQLKKLENGR